MRIKRFRGENALEVLARVKEELGEEALVLSSKRVEEGGRILYEIVAAVDREPLEENPGARENSNGYLEDLREELSEIKALLRQALSGNLAAGRYLKLLEVGVPPRIASEMEDPVRWIRERVARRKASPLSRRLIFVGPAGSGKTSTVFKVAAWFRYRKGQRVRVVALNRHRIGAHSEALRLGELLEIPVHAALPQEAPPEEILLVDTPGWGSGFGPEELEDLLDRIPGARLQAVLNAAEHPLGLERFLGELRRYPVEGVVLTRVDRLVSGLPLTFLLEDEAVEISFVSSGPRVPEDLARATPEVLERIFMRGLNGLYELK
ncbi:hypothetical protein [Thermosulfurimonas sp. F29]|uniref:flagellar biosynthesis protein FlhF n=1 Tax=Thermosulfurimonas sp. F29 TaxID=2867247 RepID=UPI001C8331BC|nr:hypothetical protein [Thermosulfurimonas sp. F29]MBX6423601.1 hypothetical protein [Thermosulfurimonas sp. F29]